MRPLALAIAGATAMVITVSPLTAQADPGGRGMRHHDGGDVGVGYDHVRRDGWRHGRHHGWYGMPWWIKNRYLQQHYGWERGQHDGWRRDR